MEALYLICHELGLNGKPNWWLTTVAMAISRIVNVNVFSFYTIMVVIIIITFIYLFLNIFSLFCYFLNARSLSLSLPLC